MENKSVWEIIKTVWSTVRRSEGEILSIKDKFKLLLKDIFILCVMFIYLNIFAVIILLAIPVAVLLCIASCVKAFFIWLKNKEIIKKLIDRIV